MVNDVGFGVPIQVGAILRCKETHFVTHVYFRSKSSARL
jgi:hypothetical protein